MEDILIFSNSLSEHREHVKKVLGWLKDHGLFAKAEKCEFEKETIQFLGLIISTTGISMDPQKVKSILEWATPTARKSTQRFIGFANFYRKFIKNVSAINAPITQLTGQSTRFSWTPAAQVAFDQLKTLFTSAPILQHSDSASPYVLEVDALEPSCLSVKEQSPYCIPSPSSQGEELRCG
ncbi:uncharacterized protein LOC143941246 [Lithobates pipiens]